MIAFGRSLRLAIVVLLFVFAGVPAFSLANGAEAARACQQGGYLHHVRQDGSGFRTVGECVSYQASGQRAVPIEIRFDPISGNEDMYCGYEIVLVNFPVGSYEIDVVSENFTGPTGTIEVTEPLAELMAFHAEAIEPVGPSLDVSATVTNAASGLAITASTAISPCREA